MSIKTANIGGVRMDNKDEIATNPNQEIVFVCFGHAMPGIEITKIKTYQQNVRTTTSSYYQS